MFQLSLPQYLEKSIQLKANSLILTAKKYLTDFNLANVIFYQIENFTSIKAEFRFQRIISYHLTNTYIPTASLLVISESTLFFEQSQMELASGLSLTILLVMYTMYQSITQSLTRTAYLKMIDYWLIFCLLVPFLIFMIELYWLLKSSKVEEICKKCWTSDEEKVIRSKGNAIYQKQPKEKNGTIKYCVISITILFIVVYVFAALIVSFT